MRAIVQDEEELKKFLRRRRRDSSKRDGSVSKYALLPPAISDYLRCVAVSRLDSGLRSAVLVFETSRPDAIEICANIGFLSELFHVERVALPDGIWVISCDVYITHIDVSDVLGGPTARVEAHTTGPVEISKKVTHLESETPLLGVRGLDL